MKKHLLLCLSFIMMMMMNAGFTQTFTGKQANQRIKGAEMIRMKPPRSLPDYVKLRPSASFPVERLSQWMAEHYQISSGISYQKKNDQKDAKGNIHQRCFQTFNQIPVFDAQFIVHSRNNLVYAINGVLYASITPSNSVLLSAAQAMVFALKAIPSERYKWQMPQEENLLKYVTGNPEATYYPKGELMLYPNTDGGTLTHRYVYKYNIYSDKPLKRADFYIDAQTGELVFRNDRIQQTDVPGTAVTRYSGNQEIISDFFNETYRLREASRGNGVETYDMNQGTDYGFAVDFTDNDNYWDTTNVEMDEVATDAHWGAEMTYDYFWFNHNRNSIDNQGFKLMSYVHYDYQYANAFWDGERMTYGDGDIDWTPLTALDICGHEITHGVTTYTCDLIYSYESGALSEGYSDIFGTAVEFYAKPAVANWTMGEDIGSFIRSLEDPNISDNPDTYLGLNWATGSNDNGGVHTNCGVLAFWFYLATMGGTGTNDNGDAYTVTGIGINYAADVAYLTLTAYLGPSSDYADARFYSIVAANEIFGGCTPQVETITNAFYAVGIGNPFSPDVVADFDAGFVTSCTVPVEIPFDNLSVNGQDFIWDFGDGTTDTLFSPVHIYTSEGVYTVKLFVDGGDCGSDSIVKTAFISIDTPDVPIVTSASNCGGAASLTLTAIAPDSVRWYTDPVGGTFFHTGTSYTTPILNQTTHYYVENQIAVDDIYGGKPDNSGGGNYSTTNGDRYLVFDVFTPILLKSVKVYAQGDDIRTIELRNSNGDVIQSLDISIPDGESRVDLNLYIEPGIEYQLAGPGAPHLYRNNGGCNYPYLLGGLASIKWSSSQFDPVGYYYFFYDWEIGVPSCISQRLQVSAFINFGNPVAGFTVSASGQSVHFINGSTDGNQFIWNFGDGNTSTEMSPFHWYNTPGLYEVTLTVTNACGTDMTTQNVDVLSIGMPEISHPMAIALSPVPALDVLKINLTDASLNGAEMIITDVMGRLIKTEHFGNITGNWNYTLDVKNLPEGIYFLVLKHDQGAVSRRFTVQ